MPADNYLLCCPHRELKATVSGETFEFRQKRGEGYFLTVKKQLSPFFSHGHFLCPSCFCLFRLAFSILRCSCLIPSMRKLIKFPLSFFEKFSIKIFQILANFAFDIRAMRASCLYNRANRHSSTRSLTARTMRSALHWTRRLYRWHKVGMQGLSC